MSVDGRIAIDCLSRKSIVAMYSIRPQFQSFFQEINCCLRGAPGVRSGSAWEIGRAGNVSLRLRFVWVPGRARDGHFLAARRARGEASPSIVQGPWRIPAFQKL